MMDIRKVTDDFSVAPQIGADDLKEAAAQGFTLVINNRPDGEVPGQPPSSVMEQAARDAGLDYVAVPFVGMPTRDQVEAVAEAVAGAKGPVLAFCRSGTRCINVWSLGQALNGVRSKDELVRLGAAAGYDLTGALGV